MSIFAGFGAAPSNLTVPLTVATVAGSIGVAAGAEAAGASAAGAGASSFLLHAASTSNAHMPAINQMVFFMMSPFYSGVG
jgi:hypothetical protein